MKKIVLTLIVFGLSRVIAFTQEGIIKTLYSTDNIITFRSFDIQKTKIDTLHILETIKKLVVAQIEDSLILRQTNKGDGEMVHNLYQQYYKGVKVESGIYFAHIKNGVLQSVNGDFYKVADVNISPKLTESEALEKALNAIGAQKYEWQIEKEEKFIKELENNSNATYYPKGEIVIVYNHQTKSYRLAYKFYISAYAPYSSNKILIDAITGDLLGKQNLISDYNTTGSADTRYSGTRSITTDYSSNVYSLKELTNSVRLETYNMRNQGGILANAQNFTDNDNNWTAAEYHSNLDDAALDAHWGIENVYAYWHTQRKRNSWDNSGSPLLNYVHVNLPSLDSVTFPTNDNAAWDYNRHIMVYGDGYKWFNPVVSLDIIGHETGHAYGNGTGHVPGSDNMAVNYFEALALNEGLADIWGACVEYYAAPTKQTWLIGEDVMKNGFSCMRSLRSPTTEGFGSYDTIYARALPRYL